MMLVDLLMNEKMMNDMVDCIVVGDASGIIFGFVLIGGQPA